MTTGRRPTGAGGGGEGDTGTRGAERAEGLVSWSAATLPSTVGPYRQAVCGQFMTHFVDSEE